MTKHTHLADEMRRLTAKGYGSHAIGRMLGVPPSSVRSILWPRQRTVAKTREVATPTKLPAVCRHGRRYVEYKTYEEMIVKRTADGCVLQIRT